jgi:hypothetical protein
MSNQLLTTINGRIEKLAASERITKVELGAVSREILQYTLEQWDCQVLNRLTAVLTPRNKQVAILFFKAFTPFSIDDTTGLFSGIRNKKAKAQSIEAIEAFLASDQTIWEWDAENNAEIEAKKPNYMANITKNVKGAIEAGNDRREIIQSVFAGGVSVDEIMAVLTAMEDQPDQVAA